MRKLACALVAAGALLAGCGTAPDGYATDNGQDTNFGVYHVKVDGKTVTCVEEFNYSSISCDWVLGNG